MSTRASYPPPNSIRPDGVSSDAVGLFFALIVLAYWGVPILHARHLANMAKREECQRIGHVFGEPFFAMGSKMRNCRRCKHQQHWRSETQEWV